MSLTLLTAPAEEPLSLADAKAFLRIDTPDDDGLIAALITTARIEVEARTGRGLVTQAWRYAPPRIGRDGLVRLPIAPVRQVTAVRAMRPGGVTVLDAGSWLEDLSTTPPSIRLPIAATLGATVEIDLSVGYGAAAAVPAPLVHAIRLLTATYYERRAYGDEPGPSAEAAAGLLAPYAARTLAGFA